MITLKDIELIENFLENKLNSEELKLFENRVSVDPDFSLQLENYKIAVESVKIYERNQFKAKLENIHKEIFKGKLNSIRKSVKIASYIGGALIILTSAYLLVNILNKYNSTNKIASINDKIANEYKVDNSNSPIAKENNISPLTNSNTIDKNETIASNNPESANTNQVINEPTSNNLNQSSNALRSGKAGDIPVVKFGVNSPSGCIPFSVSFLDSSTVNNSKISSYNWNFGDGQFSTLRNPVHTYTKNGIFTVSLTVISDKGESNNLIKQNLIKANPSPEALFETSTSFTSLNNPKVQFTNKTKYVTPKIKYSWDFGDNSGTSVLQSPSYTYSDTGHFQVVLQAKNEYNCTDNFTSQIIVSSYIDVLIPTAFSPDGKGNAVNNIYKVWADGFTEFHIWILDREGVLLYESDNYASHGWDGSGLQGSQSPSGAYVCKITLVGVDGMQYKYNKLITLLR